MQVGGILRIAHCGGLHVPQLNKLIDAINFVARLLHRHIRWDTETLGCVPSLSSIPSQEQRLLTDAMQVRWGGAGGGGGTRWKAGSVDPAVVVHAGLCEPLPAHLTNCLAGWLAGPLLSIGAQEIKGWMDAPQNADEFLILYFDDQPNLKTWVRAGLGWVN